MKIDLVRIRRNHDLDKSKEHSDSDALMFKAVGPIDSDDEILALARTYLKKSQSKEMIDSFEWAVQNDALTSDQ